MRPTPRAEQIAQPIRDALRELRIILEPEAFDPASYTREFSLAVNNYAARAIVPALACTVGNLAPRVSLDINPIGMREVLDQLDAGGMDVALTALVDGGERFKCVRVTDDDFVVLLDGAHSAARDAVIPAERLAETPHIAITSTGDDTSFVDDALEQHGLTRTIATRVPFVGRADAGWFRSVGVV
jgi:DNA-binding transcriptional LysR family regulator